jgi:integrase
MRGLKNTDTPGLFKHQSGSFWGRVSVAGRQRYKSFKTVSKTDAVAALGRWRKEMELAHAKDAHASGGDAKKTVGFFLGRLKIIYNRRRDIGPRERQYCSERIRCLFKTWPQVFRLKPGLLNATQVEAFKHRLLGIRSASTTRGTLLFLRLAMDLAVEAGACAINPCSAVKLPGVRREIQLSAKHQLSTNDFDKIIAHMRKSRGPSRRASELAELMAATGTRVSEAASITWDRVDWKHRELLADTRKGRVAVGDQNRKRNLPFFPRLEDLLMRLKARYGAVPSERICKVKECRITLHNACLALGLPSLTQHDLRHLFTTWAVEAGVDIPTIADWLGHTDGGALLMRTYRHYRREHSQNQAAKLPQPSNAKET